MFRMNKQDVQDDYIILYILYILLNYRKYYGKIRIKRFSRK